MPQLAVPSTWVNRLPAWIVADPAYCKLRAGLRHTLQTMANAGELTPAGIVGIWGGRRLLDRPEAGMSRATLFRHIAQLERLGFIVCTEVGGPFEGGNRVNVYAIPAEPGSLDPLAQRRQRVAMVRVADEVDKRGRPKYVPRRVRQGAQLLLWPVLNGVGGSVKTTPWWCRIETTGSVRMTHLTAPNTSPGQRPENAGAVPRRDVRRRQACMRAVRCADRVGWRLRRGRASRDDTLAWMVDHPDHAIAAHHEYVKRLKRIEGAGHRVQCHAGLFQKAWEAASGALSGQAALGRGSEAGDGRQSQSAGRG